MTTATDREALVHRLHRIEGQVRGIERMVEQDAYCIDVLTQVAAASRALQSLLLDDPLRHGLTEAARAGPDMDAEVTEASQAIARLVRS